MSHISTYGQKITDIKRFVETCKTLGYETRIGNITVSQFGRNTIQAKAAVLIEGWRYEVAICADGTLKYDHFGSEANSFERLGESIQAYQEAVITDGIPFDQVEDWHVETDNNGDRKIVLEYA